MTFPRPQSVREARPARQKTLLHVQGGGAPADTKKGMKSRHALPIVRRGLASAAQAGLLTRDRRREKAFPPVFPDRSSDLRGRLPLTAAGPCRIFACFPLRRHTRRHLRLEYSVVPLLSVPKAASRPPGRGRFIIPQACGVVRRRRPGKKIEEERRRKSRLLFPIKCLDVGKSVEAAV